MKPYRRYPVKKIVSNRSETVQDPVAVETYHTLWINGHELVTFICSPHDRDALSIGFLLSTGLVSSLDDVEGYALNEHEIRVELKKKLDLADLRQGKLFFRRITLTPSDFPGSWLKLLRGDDLPKVTSKVMVSCESIIKACRALSISAEIYRQTGGTHVSGLFDSSGNLIALAEDIGRHNAIDKLIGKAAFLKIDLNNIFIAFTGRITGDLINKILRVKVPIIASLSSPTSSGIAAANAKEVTLIGFVARNRIKIYSAPD
ncbi:MAG: formate dehydrogenase accessory sulfurtransferase FdhD, partial [Candidatus Ranarchaeia archaeon]